MARSRRPPPLDQGRRRQPRPHRTDLPAFRNLRRLRAPAFGHGALPGLETRFGRRGAGASGARRAGRRPDRRPWRGTPPRRIPRARDVIEVGFSALKAHHVVAIVHCPILAPGLNGAIEAAWAIAEVLAAARKPLDIQVTATDAGLDVDVRGSGPLTAADMTALAQVADRRNLARLTRHGDIVAQYRSPVIRIGRAQLVLPPGAFLQATMAGEASLARLVEAHCGSART